MGYFSWIAQDSNDSIIIVGYGNKQFPSKTVYMWDNEGRRWREDQYDGDGIFGGKDYYILLAEMNNAFDINMYISEDEKRDYGLLLEGQKDMEIIYPNLTHCSIWEWKLKEPENCPYQGFCDMKRRPIEGLKSSHIHHEIDRYDDWENGEKSPRPIKDW